MSQKVNNEPILETFSAMVRADIAEAKRYLGKDVKYRDLNSNKYEHQSKVKAIVVSRNGVFLDLEDGEARSLPMIKTRPIAEFTIENPDGVLLD